MIQSHRALLRALLIYQILILLPQLMTLCTFWPRTVQFAAVEVEVPTSHN
jgi:hypothetical protein